ncbi:MAG: PIN domain-containing protein [Actinomycetota bacterium]|nr:PIN domain-containing protein [Actinomycetota bacterium]
MDGEAAFVDTNVLVYAYDADAGGKHGAAKARLAALWEGESGVISSQVLQEFYVTVTRKLPNPLRRQTARDVMTTYAAWPVHRPDVEDIVSASQLEERDQLSFWDALIVVSAVRSGARELLTEDLQDGRRFDGLLAVNPFLDRRDGEHSTRYE